MSWTERVLAALSAKGHRVTGPRRTILERIAQYTQPFSAEQLWLDLGGDAKHGTGPIGRATIYRTVDLLVEEQWLARVHWSSSKETSAEGEHAYVPAEQGHLHHLVCKSCGTVVAFEGCDIDDLLGGLARRLNFRVDGHWLEAYGLCQICQRKTGG
ncbi:MAG TPA: Fur family transcriptional regulator [Roseiflexaceae bacterium]|nr:Fur family transcriptional regulator [Roseiflexaceae bacterium]